MSRPYSMDISMSINIEPCYNFELILNDVQKLFSYSIFIKHLKAIKNNIVMPVLEYVSVPCLIIFLG